MATELLALPDDSCSKSTGTRSLARSGLPEKGLGGLLGGSPINDSLSISNARNGGQNERERESEGIRQQGYIFLNSDMSKTKLYLVKYLVIQY